MCLVRQEQIKSPFLGSVEIPAKMWIDTDDPETLEHIYSLRTVITRVERFLRLKDALRYEKSLLEKDLQAIDNLNQFITSLLSISKVLFFLFYFYFIYFVFFCLFIYLFFYFFVYFILFI